MFEVSHPARARGLKLNAADFGVPQNVAPRAGAWIETKDFSGAQRQTRRTPRGRVD